jgi:hypothetical protein
LFIIISVALADLHERLALFTRVLSALLLDDTKIKKCRWADLHRRFPDYESGDVATDLQRRGVIFSISLK